MSTSFWKDKKVFITGHTGFKGSWLTFCLSSLGADVTGFALKPETQPNLFETVGLADNCHHHEGDVRDPVALSTALKKSQPEVVFHLAAQSLVRPSYEDPIATYATNVMGTAHLLETVRHTPSVRSVVVVTSDKCYENKEWQWSYRENDPMGGYDPYSSSKGCAELVTNSFRNSFFHPAQYSSHRVCIASARAGNVMGGGDWSRDRLIADAARAFSKRQKLWLRQPQAVRPWQHVIEPIRGYIQLAQVGLENGAAYSQAFNFGPSDDDCVSVEHVIEKFAAAWGEGANWGIEEQGQHPHEAHFLRLDSSLAKRLLKWSPRWSLERSVRETAQWYKMFYENPSPERLRPFMWQQWEGLT